MTTTIPNRFDLTVVLVLCYFSWGNGFLHVHQPIFVRRIPEFRSSPSRSIFACQPDRRCGQLSSSPSGGEGNHPIQNKDENDDDDEDDDHFEDERPYRNRSLAWTRRYRRLVSYEYARRCAMDLGLRSQEDWEDYCQDGKAYHGPYLVSRPDLMYPDDWVSWDEFLGVMRSYSETQQLVRMLQLQTPEEYQEFVFTNPKRAEGLRIPAQPHIVYRDNGWSTWQAFLNPSLDRSETE